MSMNNYYSVRTWILITAACFVASCSPSCDIEHRQRVIEPTSGAIAEVFVENCHATAPFVVAVNVRCAHCEFNEHEYVMALTGTDDVKLQWRDKNTLVVQHYVSPDVKVYKRHPRFGETTILYEEIR
jgi:hypothetical protein